MLEQSTRRRKEMASRELETVSILAHLPHASDHPAASPPSPSPSPLIRAAATTTIPTPPQVLELVPHQREGYAIQTPAAPSFEHDLSPETEALLRDLPLPSMATRHRPPVSAAAAVASALRKPAPVRRLFAE